MEGTGMPELITRFWARGRCVLALLGALLAGMPPALAEISATPQLRLDTGMHTALISRMAS
jgi:hypothetical protein